MHHKVIVVIISQLIRVNECVSLLLQHPVDNKLLIALMLSKRFAAQKLRIALNFQCFNFLSEIMYLHKSANRGPFGIFFRFLSEFLVFFPKMVYFGLHLLKHDWEIKLKLFFVSQITNNIFYVG